MHFINPRIPIASVRCGVRMEPRTPNQWPLAPRSMSANDKGDNEMKPIIGANGALIIITGLIKWFHLYKQELILIGITIIILTIIQWWWDIVREGTYQGLHHISCHLLQGWGKYGKTSARRSADKGCVINPSLQMESLTSKRRYQDRTAC